MRKGLITLLCVASVMLWGITAANAIVLNWQLLEHSSVAAKGPGADGIIGTSDDTTSGEKNKCNFTDVKNCETAGNPTVGAYSFSAIEYTNPTWYSCLDPAGGSTAGAPCVCAEPAGQPCTSDAQCSSSGSCAGAGDCCPGALNICTACTDNPTGPDSFSYFASGPKGPGTLTTCQQYTTNNFNTTDFHFATSESVSGLGGACLKLNPSNGPYPGAPCGVGAITSGTLDVDVYAIGCTILGTTIENISYTGRIVDMDAIVAASECGYSYAETVTLVNNARNVDPTAEYLMVLCGSTTVPMDSKTACLRGADTDFVVVAHTSDDASSCPASGCP